MLVQIYLHDGLVQLPVRNNSRVPAGMCIEYWAIMSSALSLDSYEFT
jgi:hypothetical protein